MKKIFIAVLVLMFGLQIVIAQTPDAEYTLIKREYTINSNRTMTYHFRKELKLNSQRAFFSMYGESFIVYSPDFQTLTINQAYTIRKDGTRVDVPKNAFVEQLPGACANCGRFSRMKEMVVVHTALEKDATIVLDYTITSSVPLFSEKICLVENAPIKKYQVSVHIPHTEDFFSSVKNPIKNQKYTYKEDRRVEEHTWEFTNLPQATTEPYAPAKDELYPVLYFTNEENKDYMLLQNDRIVFDTDALAETLKGSDLEKVETIRNYVVDNVTFNNITLLQMGNAYFDANNVWRSNCGNFYEKTLLLSALLNTFGYENKVAFLYDTLWYKHTKFYFPKENGACVRLTIDGKNYQLSAIKKNPLNPSVPTAFCNEKYNIKCEDSSLFAEKINNADTKTQALQQLSNEYFVFKPNLPTTLRINVKYLYQKRTQPLVNEQVNDSCELVFSLPENVKYVGKNVNIIKNTSFGTLEIKINQQNNKLIVKRKLFINKGTIQPKDYETFRTMLVDWANDNYKTLVFVRQ